MEAKTHILTAHPGEVALAGDGVVCGVEWSLSVCVQVFEVRDRSSGSDFWYVRRLHGIVDGQKEEGWVKASHLEPYHGQRHLCVCVCMYATTDK